MRYQYLPYDPDHYSFNLRLAPGEKTLLWESAPRQDALLVQTPFHQDALDYLPRFCGQDHPQEFPDRPDYIPVEKGIFFRFVSAAERAKKNGCPLNERACTYTLFSCRRRANGGENVCEIYAPLLQSMNPVVCRVPRKITVSLSRVAEQRGLFQRFFHPDTDRPALYRISFPEMEDPCGDGDLICQNGKFSYPILREMYQAGHFYIRSRKKPVVLSRNPGLTVVPAERN